MNIGQFKTEFVRVPRIYRDWPVYVVGSGEIVNNIYLDHNAEALIIDTGGQDDENN